MIEVETTGDSRTMFRLRIGANVIAEVLNGGAGDLLFRAELSALTINHLIY